MTNYEPLLVALAAWLDKPLNQIPAEFHERIEDAFFPFLWDQLNADQRRVLAIQYDGQNDPRFEVERQAGFSRAVTRRDLQRQIDTWNTVPVNNATEASLKENRLKQLHAELSRLKRPAAKKKTKRGVPKGYVAYPKAAAALAERLEATPAEIAAWIFVGPDQGGIAAYRNANELFPPPRFFYDFMLHGDGDYLAPLMGCWFEQVELERFQPADRFLTGSALLQRWAAKVGNAKAFIEAKLEESRLMSLHPIFGGTQGVFGNEEGFPPLETGLFAVSEIERIEAEDFPPQVGKTVAKLGSPEWRRDTARKAADAKHNKPGGSREKRAAILAAWATGKYDTKDLCAEQEAAALGISFSAARKALIGAPEPERKKLSAA
jgi:hypothetical protein